MDVTIATHNGSAVHREHNIRNQKVTSKQEHIDPNGTYEIWHDEKIRIAYDRIFGEAVSQYNASQVRPERQIKNYFNKIQKDQKKHSAYEMIVGVYPADKKEELPEEVQKEILHQFYDSWQDRNPNLELIGAYYHSDEEGEPHLHLDYIPVAHGYKNGMETQTGMARALGEMGFEKDGKATAQIQWEARENGCLEKMCEEFGYNVLHPERGTHVKHEHTAIYKERKAKETCVALEKDILELQKKHDQIVEDIPRTNELYEAKREFIKECDKVSEVSMLYPDYAEVKEKGFGKNKQKFVTVPADKWEAKWISANEKHALKEAEKNLERSACKIQAQRQALKQEKEEFASSQAGEKAKQALAEVEKYKQRYNHLLEDHKYVCNQLDKLKENEENKENKTLDKVNRTLRNLPSEYADAFIEEWNHPTEHIKSKSRSRGDEWER